MLLAYARSLGAEVEFGQEVLRVEVDDDGAEALVRDGDRTRLLRARCLIGADGARSVVRSALGIEMSGPGEVPGTSASAAFTAPLWDVVGDRRYGLYPIVHPEVPSVFVPSGRGDEWVFGVDAALLDELNEAEMVRLIRIASGVPDLEPQIHQLTTFRFAAEIADRFSDAGRVPRRGRGPQGEPARRHRDEQRDRRRIRPGMEARLGPARVGDATCSLPTRRSGVRSSPTTSSARSTSGARTAT